MRLWKDANSNAVTDAGELVTSVSAGIASISLSSAALDPVNDPNAFVRGNQIVREGSFTRTDGTTGKVGDAALVVSETDTRWTGSITVSGAAQVQQQIAIDFYHQRQRFYRLSLVQLQTDGNLPKLQPQQLRNEGVKLRWQTSEPWQLLAF